MNTFKLFLMTLCFGLILAQICSPAAALDWNGPDSKVYYDQNGACFMIDGQRKAPWVICLDASGNAAAWASFDYTGQKAASHGVNIVNLGIACITNGNTPYFNELVAHLRSIGSPYVILGINLFDFNSYGYDTNSIPAAKRITYQSKNGSTDNNTKQYETFSAEYITRIKSNIRLTLDFFNNNYPGKVIGVRLGYLDTIENFLYPINFESSTLAHYYPDYSADAQAAFKALYNNETPATTNERSAASYGNFFQTALNDAGKRSIHYNRFTSERIAGTLTELSRYIKTETANKCLSFAYYGYLNELGSMGFAVGSGHLGLKKMLESEHIDVIISPYSYNFSRDAQDAFIAHGPMDAPRVYKLASTMSPGTYRYKMWLNEDDTRTYLARLLNSTDGLGRYSDANVNNTNEVLRRNILSSAIHRTGLHFLGSFGSASYESVSEDIWESMGKAMDQGLDIKFGPVEMFAPEVAVFCDGDSAALEVLDTPYTKSAAMQAALISDPVKQLTAIGVPVRYYHISDILRDEFPAGKIKLAVFSGTHRLTTQVRDAINSKLKKDGKTLLFVYASGIANDNDAPDPANISAITGISVLKGSGTSHMESRVTYGSIVNLNFGKTSAADPFMADPWFYVSDAESLTLLGTYTAHAAPYNRSVVKKTFSVPEHYNVIYSASPGLPKGLYREIAKQAGVNIYSSNTDDVIEAGGNAVMVYAKEAGTRTVTFPDDLYCVKVQRAGSVQNVTVNGNSMQLDMGSPGEIALLYCEPVVETGTVSPSESLCRIDTVTEYTATYVDNRGYDNLLYCHIRFAGSGGPADSFGAYLDRSHDKIYFMDNAGNYSPAGYEYGQGASSFTPPTGKGTIHCQNISVSGSGDTLTVRWSFSFTSDFCQDKVITLAALSPVGGHLASTGLVKAGVCTISPDNVPPNGSISINSGAAFTNNAAVSLGISADDAGSGVWQTCFRTDDAPWGAWEVYSAVKSITVSGTDGAKAVYAKFRDKAGNESAEYSDSITLDRTPPTGTVAVNSNAAYTGSRAVTLSLDASDSLSGPVSMRFSNDGTAWTAPIPYTTGCPHTLPAGTGMKTVYARFTDGAGNESGSFTDTIILDSAPVTGTVNPINGVSNPEQHLTFTARYTDADGASDMLKCYLIVIEPDTYKYMICFYTAHDNKLYMQTPDAPYYTGGYAPGSGYSISNAYSSLDCGQTTVSTAGDNTLIIGWRVKFTDQFRGQKSVYMVCFDKSWLGSSGGNWDMKGVWRINSAPEISSMGQQSTVDPGTTLTLAVEARDDDNDTLTYAACMAAGWSLPMNAVISDTTGVFTFTPEISQAGTYEFKFTVSDGRASVTAIKVVTVNAILPDILLENGASFVPKRKVALCVSCPGAGAEWQMRFSNDGSEWAPWEPYAQGEKAWTLAPGNGHKRVYMQLKDVSDNIFADTSDGIELNYTKPVLCADINGDDKDDCIGTFTRYGVWEFSSRDYAWHFLVDIPANYMAKGDAGGSGKKDCIYADFPGYGVWIRTPSGSAYTGSGGMGSVVDGDNGSWYQITPVNSQGLATGDIDGNGVDEAIGIFPDHGGLYAFYPATGQWRYLSLPECRSLVLCDLDANGSDDIIADFKESCGVWAVLFDAAGVMTCLQMDARTCDWIECGDIDGHAGPDAVIDLPCGGMKMFSLRGSGDELSWDIRDISCFDARVFTLADADYDGRKDIVTSFWDYSNYLISVDPWSVNSRPIFSELLSGDSICFGYALGGDCAGSNNDEVIMDLGLSGLYMRYEDEWYQILAIGVE